MIVRRFMNWLRLTVAASLGNARLRSMEHNVREPVLIGAPSKNASLEQAPASLSLSSWLDNGRRLRPRLRLTPPLRESAASTTRPLRYKIQPSAQQPSAEIPVPRVSLTPLSSDPAETASVIPAVHAVDEQGGDLSNDLSDLERLDADTRRLMLLRHLVRRRVFNEGFSGNDVPKQYHRSMGLESPPPQE
jgi:hypothetical protein